MNIDYTQRDKDIQICLFEHSVVIDFIHNKGSKFGIQAQQWRQHVLRLYIIQRERSRKAYERRNFIFRGTVNNAYEMNQ